MQRMQVRGRRRRPGGRAAGGRDGRAGARQPGRAVAVARAGGAARRGGGRPAGAAQPGAGAGRRRQRLAGHERRASDAGAARRAHVRTAEWLGVRLLASGLGPGADVSTPSGSVRIERSMASAGPGAAVQAPAHRAADAVGRGRHPLPVCARHQRVAAALQGCTIRSSAISALATASGGMAFALGPRLAIVAEAGRAVLPGRRDIIVANGADAVRFDRPPCLRMRGCLRPSRPHRRWRWWRWSAGRRLLAATPGRRRPRSVRRRRHGRLRAARAARRSGRLLAARRRPAAPSRRTGRRAATTARWSTWIPRPRWIAGRAAGGPRRRGGRLRQRRAVAVDRFDHRPGDDLGLGLPRRHRDRTTRPSLRARSATPSTSTTTSRSTRRTVPTLFMQTERGTVRLDGRDGAGHAQDVGPHRRHLRRQRRPPLRRRPAGDEPADDRPLHARHDALHPRRQRQRPTTASASGSPGASTRSCSTAARSAPTRSRSSTTARCSRRASPTPPPATDRASPAARLAMASRLGRFSGGSRDSSCDNIAAMLDRPWILDDLPVAVWVGAVPDRTRRLHQQDVRAHRDGRRNRDRTAVVDRNGNPYPNEKTPFARVMATRAPAVVDDIVVRRTDGDVYIRAFGSPIFGSDGALTHVIVAFLDISKEAEVEAERQRVEERLLFACNHAPIAIWMTDADGVITMSEGAGLASLGVKSGELVGQNVFDVYGAHPTIPGYIRRALAGDSFWYTVEVGEAVYETWMTPVREPAGRGHRPHRPVERRQPRAQAAEPGDPERSRDRARNAGGVGGARDQQPAHVRAREQRRARRRDRRAGRAAGGPAGAGRWPPPASPSRASAKRWRRFESGTSRIAGITRDLRSFSRPDESTLTRVDIRTVVESVLRLVAKEVEARALLVLDLQETPAVIGNEARLVQVVLNLLVNAYQALPSETPSRNQVHVATRADGGQRDDRGRRQRPRRSRQRTASSSSSRSSPPRRSARGPGWGCSSAATSCAASRARSRSRTGPAAARCSA